MNKKLQNLLHKSLEGALSNAEQQELAHALQTSEELRTEKARLEKIRTLVQKEAVRSFKPFFSARVMNRLRQEKISQDFWGWLIWSFRLVGAAAALIVVLLLANNVYNTKSISLNSLLGLPQPSLEEVWKIDVLEENS